ncbi:hypothetical protein AB0G15_23595 [Streptosporangium sp. NPDC023825]|uniref:hypothetical protein n=1 Tax=Streptosporangium sp. NPDC023825 TaxID=3154909 RepID=UPI00342907A1
MNKYVICGGASGEKSGEKEVSGIRGRESEFAPPDRFDIVERSNFEEGMLIGDGGGWHAGRRSPCSRPVRAIRIGPAAMPSAIRIWKRSVVDE